MAREGGQSGDILWLGQHRSGELIFHFCTDLGNGMLEVRDCTAMFNRICANGTSKSHQIGLYPSHGKLREFFVLLFWTPLSFKKGLLDFYTGDAWTPVGTPDTLSDAGSVKSARSRRYLIFIVLLPFGHLV